MPAEVLVLIGSKLAVLEANGVWSVIFGLGVPMAVGARAGQDLFAGKIPSASVENPSYQDLKLNRAALRKRIVDFCICEIVLAVVTLVLSVWIAAFDEIPKIHDRLTPDKLQSVVLIAWTLLAIGSFLLDLHRSRLVARLEKLK